jgi:hypothetical protein
MIASIVSSYRNPLTMSTNYIYHLSRVLSVF